jgi:hypothetical protein
MLAALASESSLDAFLESFRDGSLERDGWTHAAHVTVSAAWLYEEPATALDRLRAGIRRHNEACGVANSASTGYHETLTRLWADRIAGTLDGRQHRLEAVREAVARYGEDSGLFRRYYSFDVVRSAAARREWMDPDLPG